MAIKSKVCSSCKVSKPEHAFHRRKTEKENFRLYSWCRPCTAIKLKTFYEANKEKFAAWNKKQQAHWTDEDRERIRCANRKRTKRLKLQFIYRYGGACNCCGETNPEFLTCDHAKNNGNEERRTGLVNSTRIYSMLKRQGWPNQEDYLVMCWNCNCGRAYNAGVCPHKEQ